MPSEKENMLAFKHYMKSDKMPCIIYADIESLIKKINGCENNSEKSSIRKAGKAYSLWIFIVNNLGIQPNRRQTYFISRTGLYEKDL